MWEGKAYPWTLPKLKPSNNGKPQKAFMTYNASSVSPTSTDHSSRIMPNNVTLFISYYKKTSNGTGLRNVKSHSRHLKMIFAPPQYYDTTTHPVKPYSKLTPLKQL
jgi:hypothetical protein